MTHAEADAAMIRARHDRNDCIDAAERAFRARREQIQQECPHTEIGRLFWMDGTTVMQTWCVTCRAELPNATK